MFAQTEEIPKIPKDLWQYVSIDHLNKYIPTYMYIQFWKKEKKNDIFFGDIPTFQNISDYTPKYL